MSGRKYTHGIAVFAFLSLGLLCPLAAKAQKINSSSYSSSFLNFSSESGESSSEATNPVAPNPFERPWGNNQQGSDAQSGDALSSVVDRKWMTAAGAYAFAAAPAFYSSGPVGAEARGWDSDLSGAVAAHLNHSRTTDLRISSDLESYGQRRQTGSGGDPGGQTLTLDWQVAHLLPSRFGAMEVAAGGYEQRLISFPAYANGPLTDVLLGYTASSVGFKASVTLPDKNITFSFRSGTEHVGIDRARVAIFELSWSW
ncbi:MAG TPA: hypothetical protein VKB58_12145 [Terriglobales bacterium]|jgi:hypothetical protein|nr:hypothetical protein [Terriglobales bacterium]